MLCRLALILASLVAVTLGIVALATTTRAVAAPTVSSGAEGLKTLIYNVRGKAVGYVTPTIPNHWNHDRAGEATVWEEPPDLLGRGENPLHLRWSCPCRCP